jgi:osmotically-inducible protein OsmY
MSALLAGPKAGMPAADERLAQMVLHAIGCRGMRAARGVTVVAQQSTFTLRGCTPTFYDKQLVLHAAQRVPGVGQIVDEVEVLPVTGSVGQTFLSAE